jgi:TolB-like protein/class 3 adenylate cyclase/Tfp pilus assembly protein PilF
MPLAREQRKLAAVIAADVVGYSRLMGRDESGTLARLRKNRSEHLDPVVTKYGGRLVKLTGDGALIEFASAVDALSAAIEFQQAMAEANGDAPADTALVFRMGLHLGDLIVDGDDLYGDGVNIAARLEAEAPGGGIVISRTVHEAAMGRLKATFDDLGSLALKNIERPIQAFGVKWEPSDWQQAGMAEMTVAAATASQVPLSLPDKPSIAVLPFQNMSGDPEQEYFADGMAEDIITALSRTKSLFVIARNSSFVYKGQSPDIRQVGRELGVRYVLEGSVRKAGNRVRITGQLIEAESGMHLWANRFDSALDDVFELQDQITSNVVSAISPTVEQAEIARSRRKPTKNLLAYDYYLRGMSHFYEFSKEGNLRGLNLLNEAINIDKEYALSCSQAAFCYVQRKAFAWNNDVPQEVGEAEKLARRALELDRRDPRVLASAGWVLIYVVGCIEEGAAYVDLAVELDPNLAVGWTLRGWAKLLLDDYEMALESFRLALRLSPLDPRLFLAQTGMANAHFLAGRYDEALSWAGIATRHRPNFLAAISVATASHALLGHFDEARRTCSLYRKFDPDARIADIKDRLVFRRIEAVDRFAQGLRLAGMPE